MTRAGFLRAETISGLTDNRRSMSEAAHRNRRASILTAWKAGLTPIRKTEAR